MTDKKFTDEEIKSSLEVIATTGNCNECKIRNCKWGTCNCSQITANAALDLINRQKAENERLKENIDGLNIFTKNHIKVIRLQAIKEFVEKFAKALSEFDMSSVGLPDYDRGYKDCMTAIEDTIDNIVNKMT